MSSIALSLPHSMYLPVRAFTTRVSEGLVLGSGSNVIDAFFTLRKLPLPGEKTYFSHEKFQTDTVVGGVTLNHLAWARMLGCPTGLMALQGDDANGQIIRSKLQHLGVSTEHVRVSKDYTTSLSHVLIEEGTGERTILMAPASTSKLTAENMAAEFASAAASASMITTEISQLPLSGVEYLLDSAQRSRIPSLMDVDVTPTIATTAARLGTMDELRRCLRKATVLKLTASAAEEVLSLASNEKLETDLAAATQQLLNAFGARLCVMTDGSRGSAIAAADTAVRIPIYSNIQQKDATGAGDAFFGGLVASIHHWGLPYDKPSLQRVGAVAAAAGAACVEVLGALPVPGISDVKLAGLNADCATMVNLLPLPKRQQYTMNTVTESTLDSHTSNADPDAVQVRAHPAIFEHALESLRADIASLQRLQHQLLDDSTLQHAFDRIVATLKLCSAKGRHVYVSGIGKSGAVAARLSVSLRSIGVSSSYIHGAEFSHGDVGTLKQDDVIILLSHSGTTIELLAVAEWASQRGAKSIAITSNSASPLARKCSLHLKTACEAELVEKIPTRSIVSQEATVNMVMQALVGLSNFSAADFVRNHPGGAIGSAK